MEEFLHTANLGASSAPRCAHFFFSLYPTISTEDMSHIYLDCRFAVEPFSFGNTIFFSSFLWHNRIREHAFHFPFYIVGGCRAGNPLPRLILIVTTF